MSTRGLVAIKMGDRLYGKYNHYDSYPFGLGCSVVELTKGMDEAKAREAIAKLVTSGPLGSTDGAQWLAGILSGAAPALRYNPRDIDFAGDSLMCEYGYVLDFDSRTLRFFEGFQKAPLPESELFCKAPLQETLSPVVPQYYPIREVYSVAFDTLRLNGVKPEDVIEVVQLLTDKEDET